MYIYVHTPDDNNSNNSYANTCIHTNIFYFLAHQHHNMHL
jgi:hypothetical protein